MPPVFRAMLRRFQDVSRAVAFYRDGLGLEVGRALEGEVYEFHFGHDFIFEVARGGPGPTPIVKDRREAADTPIFDVDDLDATISRLVQHGGMIVNEPFDLPSRRLAYVADTEGHLIGLGMARTPAG